MWSDNNSCNNWFYADATSSCKCKADSETENHKITEVVTDKAVTVSHLTGRAVIESLKVVIANHLMVVTENHMMVAIESLSMEVKEDLSMTIVAAHNKTEANHSSLREDLVELVCLLKSIKATKVFMSHRERLILWSQSLWLKESAFMVKKESHKKRKV